VSGSAFQDSFQQYPDESPIPEAKVLRIIRGSPKESPALELQVKIGGRDRKILLRLDALEEFGLSGPAAVEELRKIRRSLDDLTGGLLKYADRKSGNSS